MRKASQLSVLSIAAASMFLMYGTEAAAQSRHDTCVAEAQQFCAARWEQGGWGSPEECMLEQEPQCAGGRLEEGPRFIPLPGPGQHCIGMCDYGDPA